MNKNDYVPVGTIICSACPSAPEGYCICDGRSLNIDEYPELFALIGRTYGGNIDSFNLPDLRGLFIRSLCFDGSFDSGRTIGSLQQDTIVDHGHFVNHSSSITTDPAGSHKHLVYSSEYRAVSNVGGLGKTNEYNDIKGVGGGSTYDNADTTYTQSHTHSISLPKITISYPIERDVPMVYGRETRPVNIALPYYIKVR